MSLSHILGKSGEEVAHSYLEKKGLSILEKNWRFKKLGEIDLIAQDKNILVFIEVKTRKSNLNDAKELVTKSKISQIRKLATIYLHINKIKNIPCRFDVIALNIKNSQTQLEHIKNAF